MRRVRVGWLNLGSVSVAGQRIRHGLESFRESPGATPYVVSFVNVAGWRAEMRLSLQRGRLVVSELHVTPETEEVAAGGVTSRLLRLVPVHAHVRAFAERLRRPYQREPIKGLLDDTDLAGVLDAMLSVHRSPATPRRGRRPVAEETLLQVAAAYSQATKAGSVRPVVDTAAKLEMKMPQVRDYVHRARRRALLTPAEWGRSGGELTPQAQVLLRNRKRTASPRSRLRARR